MEIRVFTVESTGNNISSTFYRKFYRVIFLQCNLTTDDYLECKFSKFERKATVNRLKGFLLKNNMCIMVGYQGWNTFIAKETRVTFSWFLKNTHVIWGRIIGAKIIGANVHRSEFACMNIL